jgi:hypothetical protein
MFSILVLEKYVELPPFHDHRIVGVKVALAYDASSMNQTIPSVVDAQKLPFWNRVNGNPMLGFEVGQLVGQPESMKRNTLHLTLVVAIQRLAIVRTSESPDREDPMGRFNEGTGVFNSIPQSVGYGPCLMLSVASAWLQRTFDEKFVAKTSLGRRKSSIDSGALAISTTATKLIVVCSDP